MKLIIAIALALGVAAGQIGSSQAAAPIDRTRAVNPFAGGIRLTYTDYHTGKKRQGCGRIKGRWVPGIAIAASSRAVRFLSYGQLAKNYRRALASPSLAAGKRVTYTAKAAQYKRFAATRGSRCVFVAMRLNLKGAVGVAKTSRGSSQRGRASTRQAAGTLQAVLADGSLRSAVVDGSARIQSMVVSPDGSKVYLIFQQGVNLDSVNDRGTCVIAEVVIASGRPTCVDSTLQNVNAGSYYSSYGDQKPLQFDGQGAVYYAGYTTCVSSCRYVLRRSLSGEVTDLVADESQVNAFTVAANGMVFMSGMTPGTGRQFSRRLSPSGGLRNLLFGFNGGFRLFPDGNVYGSYQVQGPCDSSAGQECAGLARYSVAADRADGHLWIGNAASTFNWSEIIGTGACCGFDTFSSWDARVAATSGGEVFYFRQGNADRAYPTPARFTTLVYNVGVARSIGADIVVAGTRADGSNIVTRFSGATHTETVLAADGIGPGEIEIQHINYSPTTAQILFDGLRFADNTYVIGTIDVSSNAVSILSTNSGKLDDFQTF